MATSSVTGSSVAGRYQVIGRIASGGMGEVYRAHDAVLDREVALKVLHPQFAGDEGFVNRFRREARAAAVLNHPNVVGVYDWGVTEGTYFMVMEFVRGHNLRTVLSRYGRLEPAQVVEVTVQVLAALDHAHGQGIVHRDIKPENILIAEDGTVKVADFGLARAFADANVSQVEGTVTGTVQYLAPEQIQGDPADPRTDLYATGVVMFELLTGSPPFSGETSVAIAYKHLSERVPAPSAARPGVSADLDQAVLHATENERDERPASARAMRQEVARAAVGMGDAAPVTELAREIPTAELAPVERAPTVTIPRAMSRRARRRRRLLRTLAGLLIVAALGAGGWATWVYAVPHYVFVPKDLQGLTLTQAEAKLKASGLAFVVVEGEPSLSVPKNLVLRSAPEAGSRIRKGTQVSLVPSTGPRIISVPPVTGLALDDALRQLRDRGFVPEVQRQYDDRVAEGRVISLDPKPGQGIKEGSTVTVVVSRGPQPITLSDYAGQSEATVRAALQDLGLTVSGSSQEFSTSVRSGDVIRTVPAAGAVVHRGDTVSLVVSKGPETFPMPSVVGLSKSAAQALLSGRGLVVVVHQIPGSTGDTVVSQLPKAGTIVQQGARAEIFVA